MQFRGIAGFRRENRASPVLQNAKGIVIGSLRLTHGIMLVELHLELVAQIHGIHPPVREPAVRQMPGDPLKRRGESRQRQQGVFPIRFLPIARVVHRTN